ncbi:membrane protein [Roseobacter cerasinus]|uniref:Membrane protein n=1 Tax=Roseobacter cerasinus TaxID=2602289 RepID=A0A640VPP1_9RHOB|nr:DUF2306 domain-containing protein [Roseobacter cerasinus]GFE49051.1 membrane protein [Roseobacter cerasinus]
MSLTPLFQSSVIIVIHALGAFAALMLGTVQLMLPKGSDTHRICGYIWVGLMALVALSSFWIHDIRHFGPFSAIHLLSIYTIFGIASGILNARRGNIMAHRKTMRELFWIALVGAGAFTLLPGRVMHQVVFGQ